jgi:hypothetical protein
MLPDRDLENFRSFIERTAPDDLPTPRIHVSAAGAFDSKFRPPRDLPTPHIRDFAAGGTYDAVGGAYDAAVGLRGYEDESDYDPDDDDDTDSEEGGSYTKLLDFLADRLDDADMQTVRYMLGNLNKDLASDEPPPFSGRHRPGSKSDPLAAKNRLGADAKLKRAERNRRSYTRMHPLASRINDGSGIAQDASLEDFHNFLDSLDPRADPNKPYGKAEDAESDLLDPKQRLRSTSSAKQKFVDDDGEELSEDARKFLKAKLSATDHEEMTKRFSQPSGMDSADPFSFEKMFPNCKIRSI